MIGMLLPMLVSVRASSAASGCAAGWIAAPGGAPWTTNKCYSSAGNANTLQQCNELCAASGAAPACLESQAEVDFVLANVMCENTTCGLPHWTGHYHGDKCISGCSDQPLRKEEHELDISHYELNGREILVMSAKD